ncbi:jg12089 [Pararge aegeria aegeria]|uniref:Jg12089 protein n=1 Tax=Pararge aegeria aegeria TaxID=348720 RepID=A0A8S4QYF2_9NEOP|nr:jg12089 [Pararge aegeria aegeria]
MATGRHVAGLFHALSGVVLFIGDSLPPLTISVTRACWRGSECGSNRKSLNPRARRSEGIVGLRVPHVRPNLGSGDD